MNASEPFGPTDTLTQLSEPGRLWSRNGTASEIHPNILSPMCWSFWEDSLEIANRQVFVAMGVLPRAELRNISKDPNQRAAGCFFGRLAVNVDRMRDLFGLLPGVSADDFERDFLGSLRPGLPKQKTAWRRIPIMAVKLPLVVKSVNGDLERIHTKTLRWWQSTVLNANSGDPWVQLEDSKSHFTEAISVHIRSRFLVQIAQSALAKFAAAAGDPRLANDVVAGLGETVESRVAEDIWHLSQGEITLQQFLLEHGYHGPNESHMFTYSWRERPERVEAMAAAFSRRTDVSRPGQDARVARARTVAAEQMINGVSALRRPLARAIIAWSRNLFRNVQLGHAGYAICVDGGRAAAREVGRQLFAHNVIDAVDDVFFLTIEELQRLRREGFVGVQDVVAHRRALRAQYEITELPRSFVGNPVPITSENPVGESTVEEMATADEQLISGLGVSDGTVVGRARVLIDLDEDIELDDGDILVCANTDPSWTSILALASGLVVDLGGPASHAAIVAREMGIVCVVGTGNGTRVIPEGATIEVDGSSGNVSVVNDQRPAAAR